MWRDGVRAMHSFLLALLFVYDLLGILARTAQKVHATRASAGATVTTAQMEPVAKTMETAYVQADGAIVAILTVGVATALTIVSPMSVSRVTVNGKTKGMQPPRPRKRKWLLRPCVPRYEHLALSGDSVVEEVVVTTCESSSQDKCDTGRLTRSNSSISCGKAKRPLKERT